MAKTAKALGALEVKRLTEPGLHPVGTVPGLRLNISATGAKSWILRTMVGSKRKDIGLGGYPAVTLADAWERARKSLDEIRNGVDPVAERKASKNSVVWTFKTCALAYIETHKPSWKNAKHTQQWENTLETYVYPHFGNKHVKEVDTGDITTALRPHWSTKNETMVRVRNRIELVLAWASAQGYRPKGFNPAQWRGHLDQVFPKPSKVNNREHHPAVQVKDAYACMQALRKKEGTGARCLEFTLLTAARSIEAFEATWREINFLDKVWRIPAERMKAGRVHRVPLSTETIKLLEELPRFQDARGCDVQLVFPGRDAEGGLSNMAMGMLMRRMGFKDADGRSAVPHGLRSTFTDWCAECTSYPLEVREMALAHAIGSSSSSTEAAYRRGDLFQKRRNLMEDWAKFLSTTPAKGNSKVMPLRGAA